MTVQDLVHCLYHHCKQYLSGNSYGAFFGAALVVLEAHSDEVRFLGGELPYDFATYMGIRERTIALDPFFEVLKCEYLPEGSWADPVWDELQAGVGRVAGLQNDLVGVEKDIEAGERLNSVLVLLSVEKSGMDQSGLGEAALFSQCLGAVNAEHNQSVARCMDLFARLDNMEGPDLVKRTGRHIMQLCQTHLKWCASAKSKFTHGTRVLKGH